MFRHEKNYKINFLIYENLRLYLCSICDNIWYELYSEKQINFHLQKYPLNLHSSIYFMSEDIAISHVCNQLHLRIKTRT